MMSDNRRHTCADVDRVVRGAGEDCLWPPGQQPEVHCERPARRDRVWARLLDVVQVKAVGEEGCQSPDHELVALDGIPLRQRVLHSGR